VKTVFVLFLGLWLFLQAAFARGQQIDGANAAVATELPFKVSRGFLIVVEGQVGSLSKLRFILDTGTSRTVVDKRVARKLGIRGLPSRLLTMRQTFETESAIFSDVRFGPMRATNIPLLIADLSPFTEYTDGADGILGLDLLWGSRISIDFASKKLLVNSGTTAGAPPLQPSEIVCVTITAEVQGYPVRLLVDTGMPRILFYEDRLRKRFPQFETDNLKAVAIGQVMFAHEGMVRRIKVGTAEIQDPKVLFFHSAPAGFPENVDGVLGTASLNAQWLILDFSHGNLAWGP
jgi:predicted aspartyl protease